MWFPGFAFLLLGALWPFSAWMPESVFSRAQLSTFSSFSVSSPVVVPSVVLRGTVDFLGLSPRVSFSFLFFFFPLTICEVLATFQSSLFFSSLAERFVLATTFVFMHASLSARPFLRVPVVLVGALGAHPK